MSTMTTTDLIEAVDAIVCADPSFEVLHDRYGFLHDDAPEAVANYERERRHRSWGFVYGVAVGIARGQNPYETNEQVAARALEAATAPEALDLVDLKVNEAGGEES